jgi:hypothetical protein
VATAGSASPSELEEFMTGFASSSELEEYMTAFAPSSVFNMIELLRKSIARFAFSSGIMLELDEDKIDESTSPSASRSVKHPSSSSAAHVLVTYTAVAWSP